MAPQPGRSPEMSLLIGVPCIGYGRRHGAQKDGQKIIYFYLYPRIAART